MKEMIQQKKICTKCKESKLLTIGNFKRREAYLYFKPLFDNICRKCRDLASSNEGNKRKYNSKAKKEIECESQYCEIVFLPGRTDQRFCSRSCRLLHNNRGYKDKRKAEHIMLEEQGTKQIPEKFLKRGRIYGVDYR